MASFGDYNRVNTNVTAMDAQLSLNKINRDLGDSRLKLSTGFKINNAEDDAAGFAIATKLKSRVAGLEQALQNVSDAKSVLGVAEGAYNSITDTLIEMKSLATQAANASLGDSERGYIGTQLESLAKDINDIAASSTFNGLALLDGDSNNANSLDLTFQVGEGTGDTFVAELEAVNVKTLFSSQTNNGSTNIDMGAGSTSAGAGNNQIAAINTSGGVATNNLDHEDSITTADNVTADSLTMAAGDAIIMIGDDEGTGGEGKRGVLLIDTESASATSTGPANHNDYRNFLQHIDSALQKMNSNMNNIGIDQRSLSGKEVNLTEAITANSAAKSRIMDTDFAKEQSNSIRLQILQQTATAALSQANMGPQAVLGFLG
jgi:flagellin